MVTSELIERRQKKQEIINADDYFKDRIRLSLKDGKYCLFEHVD